MALKFEFVQVCEFSNPGYSVRYNGGIIGFIDHYDKEWIYYSWDDRADATTLHTIAAKLDELNTSLKKQRILGVF